MTFRTPCDYRVVVDQELHMANAQFRGIGAGGTHVYDVQAVDGRELASFHEAFAGQRTLGYCAASFKPRAMFFDMDATVIEQESLVELAETTGQQQAVLAITERAMAGELDFAAALRQRVQLLAGQPDSIIEAVYRRLTVNPGLQSVLQYGIEHQVPSFLVSGGFMELAEPLAKRLGFAGVHANRLEVKGGQLTGGLVGNIVDAAEKVHWMLEQCAHLGIGGEQVIATGDGANDIPMLKEAGLAIGYRPKPILSAHVQGWNGGGRHEFILALGFGVVDP